jgi:hypothetical protein
MTVVVQLGRIASWHRLRARTIGNTEVVKASSGARDALTVSDRE